MKGKTVTLWVVEGPGDSLADREAAAFAAPVEKYREARAAMDR